jgi:predicted peptidase
MNEPMRTTSTLRYFIAVSVHLLAMQYSQAQSPDSLFLRRTFAYGNGQSMPYRLFVPARYDSSKEYPLVLWLHGSQGRGTDNIRNITGGNQLGAHVWTTDSNQSIHPCFVLAPQCPDTTLWVSNDGRETPPDQLDAVVGLLTGLKKSYSIDSNRIYVAGQSLGGIAVWEIISRYPELFAAALPLCGIGNTLRAPSLTHIGIWAFHGAADSTIPVERTREMVDAIKHAGGHPKYTEYDGTGHAVWNRAFREMDLLPWVFSQRRGK